MLRIVLKVRILVTELVKNKLRAVQLPRKHKLVDQIMVDPPYSLGHLRLVKYLIRLHGSALLREQQVLFVAVHIYFVALHEYFLG